jgi:hypothetical protein
MRQIGDLLVWFVLVAVLAGVVYVTPKVARFVSDENAPKQAYSLDRNLALNAAISLEDEP